MYTGKLRIYQQFIFIAYDICISKHAFPIHYSSEYYVQMCKCAKSSSFWGTSPPRPHTGSAPGPHWLTFVREPPYWPLFILGLWGNPPPKKKIDETEEPEARMLCLLGPKSLDFINLAAITSVNLAVSAHTLTSKQPVQY